ncbi:hypothetical protein [Bradyrhizobium sp. SZCCHNR3015]|uniref:hypothetical protein n=1 Tax=Bradyrhizobium sp. SZCCHNR3015 TaxID=3057395 RepID=UPI0029160081|nr:hypothetical protein [Bradyrhizobium sp. SZCCHNR3015]
MISILNFVELENRVVAATYRNLMVKAKVVLIDEASGAQLADPVVTITSRMPVGAVRMRLPETVRPGTYFLMALNSRGDVVAKSCAFEVA